jgi:hypothetical protein
MWVVVKSAVINVVKGREPEKIGTDAALKCELSC